MSLALPVVCLVRHGETAWTLTAPIETEDDLMEWDYGAYEGRRTVDIEVERPGWRVFRDGSPGGETLDAVGARADRVVDRIRATESGSATNRSGRTAVRVAGRSPRPAPIAVMSAIVFCLLGTIPGP